MTQESGYKVELIIIIQHSRHWQYHISPSPFVTGLNGHLSVIYCRGDIALTIEWK